ncbi:MAG: flagellar hook-basal body complex protein [Sphaerobacter sp.]|nr:flagellar hook-basal body complex protein [Sphaerobacter sp.]
MTGVYATGATGLRAQQARIDTVANNLANAATTGFKMARVDLVDLIQQPLEVARAGDGSEPETDLGAGVAVGDVSRSFAPGGVVPTGNPLDLMILGPDSFFVVTTPDGQQRYTRDGHLRVDGAGQLVTAAGDRVMPAITVPPGANVTEVTQEGRVLALLPGAAAPVEIGQLTLARFANPQGLAADGHNRFAATAASGEPEIGTPGAGGLPTLMSGALEAADVDLADQMTTLIEAQRAYTANARSIQALDEMVGLVIQTRS